MYEQLRQLPAFASYTDEQLRCFWELGRELHCPAGHVLFYEGDSPQGLFVLLEGEMVVTKQVGDRPIVLARQGPGAFVGEISLLSGVPHMATGQVTQPSRLLHFEPQQFQAALDASPVMRLLITTMVERLRGTEALVQQNEKLSALGKLAAGLAHELNNPAAASLRAAKQLQELLGALQRHTLAVGQLPLRPEHIAAVRDLQAELAVRARQATWLDPLTASAREDELDEWLADHGIADGWRLAPVLVGAGVTLDDVAALAAAAGSEHLGTVLSALETLLSAADLLRTVEQSTARISELVGAIKAYSYMDQSPIQCVDIHDGLESTLTILAHKLKHINVIREYDRDLPPITVLGSQLNQVWTNLIDNAVDALEGKGRITIRTAREDDRVVVAISDDGPGIPPAILSRIFEPFFTTKGVGEGSGLGLDIVRRIVVQEHHGDVQVTSRPGETCFRVILPIDGAREE